MFPTNLFEIKIQQEETQRRAAQNRLVRSLKSSPRFSGWWKNQAASLAGKFGQEAYTLSQAAR